MTQNLKFARCSFRLLLLDKNTRFRISHLLRVAIQRVLEAFEVKEANDYSESYPRRIPGLGHWDGVAKMELTSLAPDIRSADQYESLVLQRVEECLSEGPQTLQNIFRVCEGAYPGVVLDCLREFYSNAKSTNIAGITLNNTALNVREPSILDSIEGNPVLCSWYFTAATCRRIEKLRDWSTLRLAFLGTPRLYDWFRTHSLGEKRLLLDLDQVVLDKLSPLSRQGDLVLRYDVADNIPEEHQGRFDYVFFDPPWYPNDYLLWLSRASLLAPNGHVLFSLFAELTRPAASTERKLILDFVRNYANNSTLITSFLDYDVPTYEFAQLKAVGLQSIQSWRVADLVVTKLMEQLVIKPPKESYVSSNWVEVDVGLIRFFISLSVPPATEAQLLTVLSHGSKVLPSPSRREPSRKDANVLSSRGHGLATSRPQELLALLTDLSHRYRDRTSIREILQEVVTDKNTKELLAEILTEE